MFTHKSRRVFFIGLLAFTLLSSGCGSGNKAAAVVNGEVITKSAVDRRMASLNPSYRAAVGSDSRRLLEDMIMETLLVQEARRRGLDRDSEVNHLYQEAKRQILLGRLLEVVRDKDQGNVSDEELSQFYKANEDRFVEPESFRPSHILVETQEAAQKALERLKKGEPFDKVAQEVSIDPTKTKGGDIGYFSQGQLIPEFEAACSKLKVGDLSDIVKTPLGYHIILLTDKKPSHKKSFEEVKDLIRRQIGVQRQQRQVESFVQQLRTKAQIKIHDPYASSKQVPSQPPKPSAPSGGSSP